MAVASATRDVTDGVAGLEERERLQAARLAKLAARLGPPPGFGEAPPTPPPGLGDVPTPPTSARRAASSPS